MNIRGLQEIVFVMAVGGNLAAAFLALINWQGWRSSIAIAVSSLAAFAVVAAHFIVAANLARLHHATRKLIADANVAEAVCARMARGEDVQFSADIQKM